MGGIALSDVAVYKTHFEDVRTWVSEQFYLNIDLISDFKKFRFVQGVEY